MGKSRVVDNESKMCIQYSERDGDGRVVKKLRAASNFVYKPVHQIMGAKDGYMMKVTTFPHNAQMTAFVPSNPKRDVFVAYLNNALHGNSGGLVCSLSEAMFKSELVKKINKFLNGKRYSLLLATDVLGKVPDEYQEGDFYVLSDKVQITKDGDLITQSEREFAYLPDERNLKVAIKTPLSTMAFQLAIPKMRLDLKHNLVATMFTLGSFAMTMHAEKVRKLDGSPTVVLVGPAGRGKTTGLQIAMACAGIQEVGFIKTVSKEKILQRASQCSLGVFLDDPPNISALKELFIDFFNGASRETIARGHEKIRCGLMITSNDTVAGSARELRRLVYIPFMGNSVMGSTAEEVSAHVALKRMVHQGEFSSSIGAFIQLGAIFLNGSMEEIGETYIPWVAPRLSGCLPDCILRYATTLWFTEKICQELFGMDSKKQLRSYFEGVIAPFIIANQRQESTETSENKAAGPDVINTFKEDVLYFIKNGEKDEVLQTIRYGQTGSEKCFLIQPRFFENRSYDSSNIVSHLKRSNLGTNQSRKSYKANGKSIRLTLLFTRAFDDEDMDAISKVLPVSSEKKNDEQRTIPSGLNIEQSDRQFDTNDDVNEEHEKKKDDEMRRSDSSLERENESNETENFKVDEIKDDNTDVKNSEEDTLKHHSKTVHRFNLNAPRKRKADGRDIFKKSLKAKKKRNTKAIGEKTAIKKTERKLNFTENSDW